jgi:hypothetical protein
MNDLVKLKEMNIFWFLEWHVWLISNIKDQKSQNLHIQN